LQLRGDILSYMEFQYATPLFMIDWHSHILPGLDDGSDTIDRSLAMAELLSGYGFTTVHCTPHLIRGCFEANTVEVLQGIDVLQERITAHNIPLTLLPGREYYLDEFLPEYLEDPLPLGNSRQILIEIPPRTTADMVRQLIYRVVRSGFTPVIAHPERCHLLEPVLERNSGRGILGALKGLFGSRDTASQNRSDSTGNLLLDYLRDVGCGFQGNLGSFTGFYGPQIKSVAEALRALNVYDRFGSDLHAPEQAVRILQQP
jgi:protein-tyrosine phosphatase